MARLGMVLYHGIESGAALESYARAAETAGYESLWVTERAPIVRPENARCTATKPVRSVAPWLYQ